MWLWKLFINLKFYTTIMKISIFIDSVKINVNSTEVIKTAENSIESKWIKHFNIHYHFVHQKISDNCIQLNYISTNENIADDLTKLLAKSTHQLFVNKMRLNLNIIFQTWYMIFYTDFQFYKTCLNRASTTKKKCWKMTALEAFTFLKLILLSRYSNSC